MTPENVELGIEELVLRGFAPGDRYRIGEAVEQELARLLSEQGTPPLLAQGGEIERLDGGTFEARPDSGAEVIGVQVAHAVYGGFGR